MHATTAGTHLPRKKMGRQQLHYPASAVLLDEKERGFEREAPPSH